jgi:hypothetical protein
VGCHLIDTGLVSLTKGVSVVGGLVIFLDDEKSGARERQNSFGSLPRKWRKKFAILLVCAFARDKFAQFQKIV